VFCPVDRPRFAEVSELISRAVLRCRKEKIEKLLIDSTGCSGFHQPGILNDDNLAEHRLEQNHCSRLRMWPVQSGFVQEN